MTGFSLSLCLCLSLSLSLSLSHTLSLSLCVCVCCGVCVRVCVYCEGKMLSPCSLAVRGGFLGPKNRRSFTVANHNTLSPSFGGSCHSTPPSRSTVLLKYPCSSSKSQLMPTSVLRENLSPCFSVLLFRSCKLHFALWRGWRVVLENEVCVCVCVEGCVLGGIWE